VPGVTQCRVPDVYPRPGDSPCWRRMAISLLRHLEHCCRRILLVEGVQTSYLADRYNNAGGIARVFDSPFRTVHRVAKRGLLPKVSEQSG